MNDNNKSLRYIAYIRKSEEREERQQLSHEAQRRKIKEQFPDLTIVKWMDPESRSAFKPGRPIFDEMIRLIDGGKADGLVFYSPNRASRNEIDAAAITYRLRGSALKDLKFCTYSFENTNEGILMLQMLLSQSQYESAKQGKDVKRGMVQKAISGERPGIVPTGYMKVPVTVDGQVIMAKDKVITKTVFDPERIELVKKMWTMLLSGVYTPRQIRKIANEEWNYTLRKTRKTGGKPIGLSSIYRIFNNLFYTGSVVHEGEVYAGVHEGIITLKEFDEAQRILGKRGRLRTGEHAHAYTGLVECGECGCSIVGKSNTKFIKGEKRMKTYVHYYCTRKSDLRPCTQSIYTSLEAFEAQVDAELAKYTILPEFRDLALEILNRSHKVEVHDRSKVYKMQQIKRRQVQDQLDSLVDMRTRNLLDDDEYTSQRNRLKAELARIDESLRGTETRADDWLELTEKAFNFATYARIHFRDGDTATKRGILITLGQNLTLKDQKISLTPSKWLVPIAQDYPAIEAKYLSKVRTNKKATPKVKEMALASISDEWRARRDLNPRHPA
jgi:site-specific DNA recombinase